MQNIQYTDEFSELSEVDFEDIIIKACFKKTDLGNKTFPVLTEDLFFDVNNKAIIKALKAYYKQNEVWPKIRELYDFELTGSSKKKFEQIGLVNIGSYREEFLKNKVEEFIQQRKFFLTMQKAQLDLMNFNKDTCQSTIESIKDAISFSIETKRGVSIKKDVSSFMDYLKLKMKIVPSALTALNGLIGGGYPSKAISVYYGQSNIGKTTVLCSEAASCFERGFNVLYISLEMPDFEIFKKIASNLLTIPVNELKDASTENVKTYLSSISKADLKIVYAPAYTLSADDIKTMVDDMLIKEGFSPDIIFIDYINCMVSNKGDTSVKHENLGYVTKELENCANELDCPMVTASQFNRSGYGNQNAGAANVGESLDIYKYSSVGISMYRDQLMQKRGFIQFGLIKNRYGATEVNFIGKMDYDHMKLSDATQDDVKNLEYQRTLETGTNTGNSFGVPTVKTTNKPRRRSGDDEDDEDYGDNL